MTDTIKAVAETWQPSAYVLRKYAEDMDTNTRLIDADIAPYLRKVAAWVEAMQIREMTVEEVALLFELEGRRATYLSPLDAAKALTKLGTIRIKE